MNQAQSIIRSFNLPTSPNAFVQQSSRDAEMDNFLFARIAESLAIDVDNVPVVRLSAFVQYAVVELMNNSDNTIQQAQTIAQQKTDKLYNKHPYFKLMETNQRTRIEVPPSNVGMTIVESVVRPDRDKKTNARQLFDAYRQSMTTAELVNLIAQQLHITKANSRYYVMAFSK